ncbi:MAG: MFS transporter [Micromonosporaceae bacterium]
MQLAPYRRVLSLSGVKSLLALSMLARMPVLAGSMVLTLYVVLELKQGFGAAGAVFAACIFGAAVGQPMLGRFTDRYGLRPVAVVGTVASATFWACAGFLPYPALLATGFLASLVQVPVFTTSRQGIAALVPEEHRRAAYSLDSIAVELSYMAGPSVGVVMVTQTSAQLAIWAVGLGVVATGVGFFLLNPPMRAEGEGPAPGVRMRLRTWMRPGIVAVLIAVGGATLVLGATEVVVVAVLKDAGELGWASLVLAAWGLYSMTGGVVYGGLSRAPGPIPLMLLLGLCTLPLAFAGNWFWLCVALLPAGLMCAPTLAGAADAMSRLAPPSVRGEAMGYYGAAINIGLAVGTPAAGLAVDLVGPAWGFVVAGGGGVVVALVAAVLQRLGRRSQAADQRPDGVEPAVIATTAPPATAQPATAEPAAAEPAAAQPATAQRVQ